MFNRFILTLHNDWSQITGKYNWYSFTFLYLYFEYDRMFKAYDFTVCILGLGVTIRYNTKASDDLYKELLDKADI